MGMQRDILKQYLRAGPSRRFDIALFTGKLPKDSPPEAYMFANAFLNGCILFKWVDLDHSQSGDPCKLINTLIYLPYDAQRPGDGGESLVFSDESFLRLLEHKVSAREMGAALAHDIERLRILDSLPTFSPFVVELAFQRAGIDIPEAYLQLTPEVREKLTAHLKGRLRPLIVAAYRRSAMNVEKAVEDLTVKLFCLRDIAEVMPLIEALQLPADIAQDVLNAWIGIAYFEYEYASLQSSLKHFAGWMMHHAQSAEPLTRQDREYVSSLCNAIRQRVRVDWNGIVSISTQYRETYDEMVFRGNLEPFVRFLQTAQSSYWRMGEVLGRLEQAVLVWKHFTRFFGDRKLPFSVLFEMLGVLRDMLLAADRPYEISKTTNSRQLTTMGEA
jgi:hypothetical protein